MTDASQSSSPAWQTNALSYRRTFELGTRRQPFELPTTFGSQDQEAGVLDLLAAMATAQRFELPAKPSLSFAETAVTKARFVDAQARTLLKRLFGGAQPDWGIVPAQQKVLGWLSERQLSLHPFDYVHLSQLFEGQSDLLDPLSRRFESSGDILSSHDDDEVTAENWQSETPAIRLDFLIEQRRANPDLARTLFAEAAGTDTAAVRSKLLEAFVVGLSASDQELLEKIVADDRAASVRSVAVGLLANLPGTQAYQARVDDALSRLTLGKRGLLRAKPKVQIDYPGTLKKPMSKREWIVETFGGIETQQIAAHLELSVPELLQATEDVWLFPTLLMTLLAQDLTLAKSCLAERQVLGRVEEQLYDFLLANHGLWEYIQLSSEASGVLLQHSLSHKGWTPDNAMQRIQFAYWLSVKLDSALDDDLGLAVLGTKAIQKWLADEKTGSTQAGRFVEYCAALFGPRTHERLREVLEALPPAHTGRAGALCDLVVALDASAGAFSSDAPDAATTELDNR